ncbi:MAG: hypothetical protein EBS07_12855 [Sphingobacteriia bacterium]|nr:hypothetical protein [Sphingobacteriia bacterium]
MFITTNNTALIYAFAAVLQDPTHLPNEQPRFGVRITDQNGLNLNCGFYEYISGQGIPFQQQGQVRYRNWSTFAIDLTPYIGQTSRIFYWRLFTRWSLRLCLF